MRKLQLLFLMVALSGFACIAPKQHHYISFKTAKAFHDFLNRKTTAYPLLSAHRGAPMPGFPENAIETFENATTYQPVIIEFDVALSKDSALVIMHDDRLDRTTNGKGLIGQQTYAQLKALNLKDNEGQLTNFKIPTLEEVLRWGKDKVLFTIDIKRGVPYPKIIEAVRKTKSETNAIIITYNANQAAEVHRLAPDLMISATVKSPEDLERLNKMGVPNHKIIAFVGISEPHQNLYQYLHSKGISTILGTMGNLDTSAKASANKQVFGNLVANGADVLSTDELKLAGQQLDAYRKDKQLKLKNINIR
ncbi:glycerophosphodiester phosphodiesterase family protein [Pedobacter nanyangensis]|uniref:glycerophosphodiester phosphodiesterase family protein n=1 Tax=Pedobacter nanyangensis TaxID=1562389 RepID=UPI001F06708E|nr:glycerophosphodiester phosphodiesterase family protein [Pedobacter nanyangensis]